MYYILALLTGVLISILIVTNGGLAATYGLYSSMVILHIIGFLPVLYLIWRKNEKPFSIQLSLPLYLGGLCNAVIILFASYAYRYISVSAILALGLLGQSVTAFFIDHFGLLGSPIYPLNKRKILGIPLILIGACSMIDGFFLWPVILAFAGGFFFVISRTLNAKLATSTNTTVCTFYHYLSGLIFSILIFLVLGRTEISYPRFGVDPFSSNWFIYFGGLVGILVIFLGNLTVPKIPALHLTLLAFVGQVTTGIFLDIIIIRSFPPLQLLIGVPLVTLGFLTTLFFDWFTA